MAQQLTDTQLIELIQNHLLEIAPPSLHAPQWRIYTKAGAVMAPDLRSALTLANARLIALKLSSVI